MFTDYILILHIYLRGRVIDCDVELVVPKLLTAPTCTLKRTPVEERYLYGLSPAMTCDLAVPVPSGTGTVSIMSGVSPMLVTAIKKLMLPSPPLL